MKKTLLLLALLAGQKLNAQEVKKQVLNNKDKTIFSSNIGLTNASGSFDLKQVDINQSSTFTTSPATSNTSRYGFKIAAAAELPFKNKHWSFNPELALVSKGLESTLTFNETGSSTTNIYKIKTNFIEASFGLNYYLDQNKKLFVGFAPTISIGAGGGVKGTSSTYDSSSQETLSGPISFGIKYDGQWSANNDNMFHFKSIHFGSSFTVGYKFSDLIYSKLLYNVGFNNLFPTNTITQGFNSSTISGTFNTSYLSLSVGVAIK